MSRYAPAVTPHHQALPAECDRRNVYHGEGELTGLTRCPNALSRGGVVRSVSPLRSSLLVISFFDLLSFLAPSSRARQNFISYDRVATVTFKP
jgi:hypothetical protein